jgi:hypothetical protein
LPSICCDSGAVLYDGGVFWWPFDSRYLEEPGAPAGVPELS